MATTSGESSGRVGMPLGSLWDTQCMRGEEVLQKELPGFFCDKL